MRKLYLFLTFLLFCSNFSLVQNKLDLRSPDKQKYFAGGAVIGGALFCIKLIELECCVAQQTF